MSSCNSRGYPVPEVANRARAAQWSNRQPRKPFARAAFTKARGFRSTEPIPPIACEEIYQGVAKAACSVGCSVRSGVPEPECEEACFAQTVRQYPQDDWCPVDPDPPGPDPVDPCEECVDKCGEDFQEYVETNCPEVCANDWEGEDCRNCLELGECRWAKCLAFDCEEPCGGQWDIGQPNDPLQPGDPLASWKRRQAGAQAWNRPRSAAPRQGLQTRVALAKLANNSLY
jgi:hypothetical protein